MAFVVSAVVAAFEVGATAAVIATAVSEVGLAMSVVGAVTGSKDLMKVGGIIGLAGGIGGLAAETFGGVAASTGEAIGSVSNDILDTASAQTGTAYGSGMASDAAATGIADAGASAAASGTNSLGTSTAAVGGPAASAPAGIPPVDASLAGSPSYSAPAAVTSAPPSGAPVDVAGATGAPSASVSNDILDTASAQGQVPGQTATQYGSTAMADSDPNSLAGWLKSAAGSTSTWFNGLKPQAQAEFAKSLLAIPGGIQAQKNKANELAMTQQKINQSGYGSSVPTFGIIAKAQKG